MSSERAQTGATILEESARIAEALLKVQHEIVDMVTATEARLLEDIRRDLGYTDTVAVDTEGLVDTRISDKTPVVTPNEVATVLPLTAESAETTRQSRLSVEQILRGEDDRLIVIVGPCSIHDPEAALEYADKILGWREKYGDNLEILMRAYIEQPRSEKGWKGFVYDPFLDKSNDINVGLVGTRMIFSRITNMGVPIATERLNNNTPQYVNGLVTYDAIGARNAADQKSREYGSGTSSILGNKNATDGSVEDAIQASVSAGIPHTFLGMSVNGLPMQVETLGNSTAHVILRGGKEGPNFSEEDIAKVTELQRERGLIEAVVVDASHANSGKKAENQPNVIEEVARQVRLGTTAINGVMIESNLVGGAQKLDPANVEGLEYGISITDECVGIPETELMLDALSSAAEQRRQLTVT